jgi:hypothetical protein
MDGMTINHIVSIDHGSYHPSEAWWFFKTHLMGGGDDLGIFHQDFMVMFHGIYDAYPPVN